MDFSTRCIVKNESGGEVNYSPVPVRFARELDKTGLRIHVFYEHVSSPPVEAAPSASAPLRAFSFYCLLQLLDGDGFFYDPGKGEVRRFAPGYGLLVPPSFRHRYGGFQKPFTEDSICFSGPAADTLYRTGLLRGGILYFGQERRILPIIRLIREATLPSQFAATALLLKLLVDLHGENLETNAQETSPHAKLNLLMREIRSSHRWWTVEEMAEYANMSENHLRKLFREQTGTSPKHFLDQLWLNRAIDLLCSTPLPLSEAARKTGCADPYYFFRRFKKLTGCTPAQYRRIYGRKYPAAGNGEAPGTEKSIPDGKKSPGSL